MPWSLSPPSPQRWKRQGIPPFARVHPFGADGDGASVTAGHMHCFALRGARPPGLVLGVLMLFAPDVIPGLTIPGTGSMTPMDEMSP